MQIYNIPTFKGNTKIYQDGNLKIKDSFYDNNILESHTVFDEFDHVLINKRFDRDGLITSSANFEYYETNTENGLIETFKDKGQEYIRKAYTKIENGLKHFVDDFTSISAPQKSYKNEFVSDLEGNLLKLINNGIETVFKRK